MKATVLGSDLDAMPLAVVQRMIRVVPDAVLVAQFGCDLIEDALDLESPVIHPVSGKKPCPAAACIGECVQDVHVDGVLIAAHLNLRTTLSWKLPARKRRILAWNSRPRYSR